MRLVFPYNVFEAFCIHMRQHSSVQSSMAPSACYRRGPVQDTPTAAQQAHWRHAVAVRDVAASFLRQTHLLLSTLEDFGASKRRGSTNVCAHCFLLYMYGHGSHVDR